MVQDLMAAGPMLVLTFAGLLALLIAGFRGNSTGLAWWVALAGFVVSGFWAAGTIGYPAIGFAGMLATGGSAAYWTIVFSISGGMCVLLSREYLARHGMAHGEYYALLLFAVNGMVLMASATDLVVFFLGLEMMSISFYVLAGFARTKRASNEAALKYFLLGAFATGFLLYGIALVYGTTGSTNLQRIVGAAVEHGSSGLFLIGLSLIAIGMAFKVAAVPFHMWVPDVYEGSPTTVTAFMSTGGKSAAFAALLLIFSPVLMRHAQAVRDVLAVLAALSMVLGNLIALSQTSVKRMLAYSSIAHAGYILSGIVAANNLGATGVLFYLLAYTLMNAGAFGVLAMEELPDGKNLSVDDYTGYGKRRPFLAAMMAVFMFSLAGVPPFAGFFGKYYVFAGAVEAGYTWLAIVGVVMSVVSAFYYLRLVVTMYFRDGEQEAQGRPAFGGVLAIAVAAFALLGLGVLPSAVVSVTRWFF